jgi:hypothetical protein
MSPGLVVMAWLTAAQSMADQHGLLVGQWPR